jgi:hypothetical protein
MIPLYTNDEYNSAKSFDKLPLKCSTCGCSFLKDKYQITQALKPNSKRTNNFCSHKCRSKSMKKSIEVECESCYLKFEKRFKRIDRSNHNFCSKKCASDALKKRISTNCHNCNKPIIKTPQKISINKHVFCSKQCSGLYNSKHKTHGNCRSKLEIWLEVKLTNLYPNLKIFYNDTTAINHELDIYIPNLNLAFELNGIFHYEPIFGVKRLESSQRNDLSKSKACFDTNIDLYVIDTTSQKYFKEKTSEIFLNIITNTINQRTQ